MMDHNQIITAFQQLTSLSRPQVTALFQEHFSPLEEPDFYIAITKALSTGIISVENARIASMVHLTGVRRDRAIQLLEGRVQGERYNLVHAILEAWNRADIRQEVAVTAQMRVLTNLPRSRAQSFLQQTNPPHFLEAAIAKARHDGAISSHVAAMGILKVVTRFSDAVTAELLVGHNNVERAIVEGRDRFEDKAQYAIARLQCRFRMPREDAAQYLSQPDVRGDFEQACRRVKVDQIMDQVIVDREDAQGYLQASQGNVDNAVELARANQLLQPMYGGMNADTRNPPDVHHNTHIIGVLGVCDMGHQRRASPRRDGWMVSDFYLWISVLRGMGKSQSWLSCENPYALLSRYGTTTKALDYTDDENQLVRANISWQEGYLHGDPFEERAVVLSQNNVDEMATRVKVSGHGTTLRDDFLRCLEHTCKIAEAANEPVLLMAFCHGDDGETETGGLCVGIDPGSQHEGDFLSPKLLATSLAKTPNVRVSLYLTSCFSGNWVITPQLRLIKPTVMAAAQPHEESYAWEASSSQRHAGGVYTSAFLKELHKEPIDLPEDAAADDARSYEEVCRAITSEANRLWVQLGGSTPMFTLEGGHDKFWQRTGFSLADYKKNYDRLKKVPASDPNPYTDRKRKVEDISDEEFKAWQLRHPEDADQDFGSRTGGYGKTRRGLEASLTYLANRYMASRPGPRNAPSNTALQDDIEMFRAGRFAGDLDAIERIRSQVLYRTWMMRKANDYRKWMNLNKVPVIEEWDEDRPGTAVGLAKANLPIVKGAGLFSRPDAKQGYWGQVWQKPARYLAYAFAASGYGPREVPKHLEFLKQTQQNITTLQTKRYTQMPTAKRSISQMSEILSGS